MQGKQQAPDADANSFSTSPQTYAGVQQHNGEHVEVPLPPPAPGITTNMQQWSSMKLQQSHSPRPSGTGQVPMLACWPHLVKRACLKRYTP